MKRDSAFDRLDGVIEQQMHSRECFRKIMLVTDFTLMRAREIRQAYELESKIVDITQDYFNDELKVGEFITQVLSAMGIEPPYPEEKKKRLEDYLLVHLSDQLVAKSANILAFYAMDRQAGCLAVALDDDGSPMYWMTGDVLEDHCFYFVGLSKSVTYPLLQVWNGRDPNARKGCAKTLVSYFIWFMKEHTSLNNKCYVTASIGTERVLESMGARIVTLVESIDGPSGNNFQEQFEIAGTQLLDYWKRDDTKRARKANACLHCGIKRSINEAIVEPNKWWKTFCDARCQKQFYASRDGII
jgi:ribosomal protein S14